MMQRRRIILMALVLIRVSILYGQTYEYAYDNNGNRVSRSIVVEQLQSKSDSFPVVNQKSLQALTNDMKTQASENLSEDGEIETLVYPNPNKGLLKIDISNMPAESKKEMRLYDLSGNELIIKKDFDSYSELDINKLKNGVYVLRIKINDKHYDFKVIKN
jgi:hypothetical protein